MSYKLRNIEQCYLPWANLPGKMADNMHSHKNLIVALITSYPVSVLFLPQLGKKIPWFLTLY